MKESVAYPGLPQPVKIENEEFEKLIEAAYNSKECILPSLNPTEQIIHLK